MGEEPRGLDARFLLKKLIGTGKFGSVYEAEQLEGLLAGRRCAVKVLDIGKRPDGRHGSRRARFRREIALFKNLQGPHIVSVIDADEDPDGTLWFAMHLFDESDLSKFVPQSRPIAPAIALEIAAQAADGLQSAHARGVVHRDVKPQNILVERMGPRPHVYVTDFGIAKFIEDETITQSLDSPHTPVYGAPEQFNGGDITRATDVCGLGRTLFNLVTGELPPRQGAALPVDGLDPSLAALLRSATRPDPGDRPAMEDFGIECRVLAAKLERAARAATISSPELPAEAEAPATADGATDTTYRKRPRRRVARRIRGRAVLAVVAVAVAAAVGVAVGDGNDTPKRFTVRAGPLRVSYSAPWARTAPRPKPIPGLVLSDPATLVHGRGTRRLFTMGSMMHPAGGANPAGPRLRHSLGGSPHVVRLGGLAGLSYRQRSPGKVKSQLVLIPTSVGWTAIACTAPAKDFVRFQETCDDLAETVTLSGAHQQALEPDPDYARSVTARLARVDEDRSERSAALHTRSLSKRARAAAAAADTYRESAAALSRQNVRLQDRAGQRLLVDGLRSTATALDQVSRAARHHSASAYHRAASRVAAGDGQVRHGLSALEAAGYRVVHRPRPRVLSRAQRASIFRGAGDGAIPRYPRPRTPESTTTTPVVEATPSPVTSAPQVQSESPPAPSSGRQHGVTVSP